MKKEDLWAKTLKNEQGEPVIGKDGYPVIGESLLDHMKAVGNTAARIVGDSLYFELEEELAGYLGVPKEEVIPIVKYISAMHDIGKCHPHFQKLAMDLGEYAPAQNALTEYRHELGSEAIAKRIWKSNKLFDMKTTEFFSTILRLHHQRKGKRGKNYSCNGWEGLQNEVEAEIRRWSGIKPFAISGHCDAACTLIAAILILSDWIASSDDIEGAFRAMHLAKANSLEAGSFKEMFGFEPRTLQKELEHQIATLHEMPLLAVIEAPMGEGKTEAGIYLAFKMAEYWKKNGLYFALPTTATSNQMVGRVRKIIRDEGDAELIHSTSWLIENEEKTLSLEDRLDYLKWKGPKRRAMLARFGVGTVDQAMTTVLKVRYGVLRILGLSNKVLIIDELHSYDAYMSTILERLVEWCKELLVPVVMLSATLPKSRKEQMLKINGLKEGVYPIVTEVFLDGNVEELPITSVFKQWDVAIDFQESITDIPEHGCTLIIANTIKKAIEIYEDLKIPAEEKMLFHSRFTIARREEIEQKVTAMFGKGGNRPSRMVLVATQVVEQSLDVDFDRMYTELAPIDLVLQRIGRLHRHDIQRPAGLEKPKCTVFADGLGTGKFIYYELLLERSRDLLKDLHIIHIPTDIPRLVEIVYNDEPDQERLEAFIERHTDTIMQEGTAKSMILPQPKSNYFCLYHQDELWDDEDEFVDTHTRLGADSVRMCIVPQELYEKAKGKPYIDTVMAKDLYRYMITAGKKFRKYLDVNEHFRGQGKLSGCEIIKATDGNDPTKTMKCAGMRADKELGLITEG